MRTEELIKEKRRYGLPEIISNNEKILLDSGLPIQKIIGFIDFDNLRIGVTRNVLIPRYETQEVVNEALLFINKESKVLDLCCGSGYIGLTINHKTSADVTLSDISSEAIEQTRDNASQHKLDVKIVKSDMFKNITGKFDVIVSNPPYIPSSTKLDKSVTEYEPDNALFGGEDGNKFYKEIIENYKDYLNPNGILILEISEDNVEYIKECGFEIKKDINGKNRIAIITS